MNRVVPYRPYEVTRYTGPAMKACTEGERAFVVAMLEFGGLDNTAAARAAGYGKGGTDNALRVTAHRLAHSPRVLAAIREEAEKRLHSGAILAASVITEIARDPLHKDRFKAAERLLNQAGLDIATRHQVEHVDHRTTEEIRSMAASLMQRLGLDPTKQVTAETLRAAMEQRTPVVDAEFEDVGSADGLEDLL